MAITTRATLVLSYLVILAMPCGAQGLDNTWEWTSTEYRAGGTDTPTTVGHTIQLFFGSDGSFVRYQDEAPVHVGTWSMYDVVIWPYLVGVLSTSAGDAWWSTSLSGDQVLTLVLKDWVELPSGISGPATHTETYVNRSPVAEERLSWGRAKLEYR